MNVIHVVRGKQRVGRKIQSMKKCFILRGALDKGMTVYSILHLEPPESEFGSGGEARVASTKHGYLLLLAHPVLSSVLLLSK